MGKRTVVELEDLRNRLREAEETLSAIRNGDVDSLVVSGPQGDQVFSLKGAEQPYRVFVEQMFEGAVTLTVNGTILYSNARFAAMMRSPLQKVIGAQIQSFIRDEDHDHLITLLREAQGTKARFLLSASDSSLVPAQLAFSRMPIGEVESICLVVTDITEQEERRELTAAMEKLRVTQQQLQRQNEELTVARAAAEAANEAKDNFLASLSHELRTPLAPIMMTAAALERSASLSEEVRNGLAMIRRNAELEAHLIDDLLDVTRIARGKIEFKPRLLDAHEVLNNALEICESDFRGKKLELIREFHATETHLKGDIVRIQQILWNVLRNAWKFTPEGGRIIVRTENNAGTLRITVTDTGIGMDELAMGKIFTPFEQTDRGITRRFGGLGLGLYISKRLAEMHGGNITATSPGPGEGSTFVLTLPTTTSSPARPDRPAEPATQPPMAGRLRILLVEDHEDTRESLGRLLGRMHEVQAVASMATALQAAGTNDYDLVISDLGLPDGTGFELMQQLRTLHNLRGICLSGYGTENDVSRSREAGFDHHLTKPVDLDQLESVIRSFAE